MPSPLRRIRTKLEPAANRAKVLAGIGNYWTMETGRPLDVRSLIFPLRFDVDVRRQFFALYRHLRGQSVDRICAAASSHPYRMWVEHVLVPRNHPEAVGRPDDLDEIFRIRVRRSIAIHDSIEADGFDRSQPIIPYTGDVIRPSPTGRIAPFAMVPGDGCHRLACLAAMGIDPIPAEYTSIRRFRRLTPLDNTAVLAKHLSIEAEWLEGL